MPPATEPLFWTGAGAETPGGARPPWQPAAEEDIEGPQ